MSDNSSKVAVAILSAVFIIPCLIIWAFTRRIGIAMWPIFAGMYGLVSGLGKAFEAGFSRKSFLHGLIEMKKEGMEKPTQKSNHPRMIMLANRPFLVCQQHASDT